MNGQKNPEHSIDIYYDNLKDEFVVKLIDNLDGDNTIHFRNKLVFTCMGDCLFHLSNLS